MLRFINLAKFVGKPARSIQCPRRLYHRKEFVVQSNFFDEHPIDQHTIDTLAKLDAERKSGANIDFVRDLFGKYEKETKDRRRSELSRQIRDEFKKFPNRTHPTVLSYGPDSGNVEIDSHGDAHLTKTSAIKDYVTVGDFLNILRLGELGNFTGSGSYYLMHSAAELVTALHTRTKYKKNQIIFHSRNELSSDTL